MDGVTLLREAVEAGLMVSADGDLLRVRGPRRSEPVARRLLDHKAEVLAAMSNHKNSGDRDTKTPAYGPQELSFAERVEGGYVNPGWTPEAWAVRLRELALRCEAIRPELAAQYRTWAANVMKSKNGLA